MEIENKEINFKKEKTLNAVDERKSYLTTKVVQVEITGTWDYVVDCWFAPRSVTVNGWQGNIWFQTFSDFLLTYGIFWYDNAWTFTVSNTSNMVETTTTTGNPTKRLYNGFNLNISSFWGSNFYVNFICFA
jgi:hypothetical protein